MKKTLAMLLAALMLVSVLVACGNDSEETSNAGTSGGETSNAGTSGGTPGTSQAADPAAPSTGAQTLGWYPDAYEASLNREKYTIGCVFIAMSDQLHSALNVAFREWSQLLNFDYVSFDANGSHDAFFSGLETYAASPDIHGILIDIDASSHPRVLEIVDEYGATWFPAMSPFRNDAMTRYVAPAAVLEGYSCGQIQVDWMFDNYARELGVQEVDASNIGFITLNWSPHPEINLRIIGAEDRYNELYPNLLSTNWIPIDVLPGSPANIEGAFDLVSAYLSTNGSDFEYWFIGSATDEFAIGAARAVEQVGMESKCIISAIMGGSIIEEWSTGKTSTWRALITTPLVGLAEPMVCGLLAVLDGRATFETLYQEYVPAGESYGIIVYPPQVFTHDNWREYISTAEAWVAHKYQ